jgi:molybdenum cofactor synthesis domain-containing protein
MIGCQEKNVPVRVGILTVSDKASQGEREDTSGPAIRELLAAIDSSAEKYEIVPDDAKQISDLLRRWCDEDGLDLILTTGGSGLGPRDVTPEATAAVLDRLAPGIPEALRQDGLRHTPMAMLSRNTAGLRGKTLIINFPGSERAVREGLSLLMPVLIHAIEIARGVPAEHLPPAPPA